MKEQQSPYAFVSYAHEDEKQVYALVNELKKNRCHLWIDQKLEPGESWTTNLAWYIARAECLILMVSAHSLSSYFVEKEIRYAVSQKKTIIPVMLANVPFSDEQQFLLGDIQQIMEEKETDSIHYIKALGKKILQALPKNVIGKNLNPFLQERDLSIFLKKDIVRNIGPDKHVDSFHILAENKKNGEWFQLFSFDPHTAAYDADYFVNQCIPLTDDLYTGVIHGIYQVNILARFLLDYPLYGPDIDVLMFFVLRVPEDEAPSIRLVDYQYTHISGNKKINTNVWGNSIDQVLRKLL